MEKGWIKNARLRSDMGHGQSRHSFTSATRFCVRIPPRNAVRRLFLDVENTRKDDGHEFKKGILKSVPGVQASSQNLIKTPAIIGIES